MSRTSCWTWTWKSVVLSRTKLVTDAEVSSGREKFTVRVRISGDPEFNIEPAFLVFRNSERSYPVEGLPDNLEGVSYRTEHKSWIDRELFIEYFKENRMASELNTLAMVKVPKLKSRLLPNLIKFETTYSPYVCGINNVYAQREEDILLRISSIRVCM